MDISKLQEKSRRKAEVKAAIIGASTESLHTIAKAKEHGITVLALDGNADATGLKMADQAVVVDISNEEKTIDAVKRTGTDFVLTVPIGRYLTTIGSVNDTLGLPGISKQTAVYCTDKLSFHSKMQEKNLRQCNCYEVKADLHEREDLCRRIKTGQTHLEYPSILKPRYGSGSRGIHFINSYEELQKGMKHTQGEDYILEECISGEEYGVDGAVIDEQFYLVLLRKKENTPLPVRQAVAYFSVMPEDEFYVEIKAFMEKAVKVLDMNDCLLHADIISGENGPFIVEMSARPSGHNLHNLFTPLCTGIDVAEEYVKYRIGKEYNFVPKKTKQMMIHYFDLEGTVTWVPEVSYIENILGVTFAAWECNIKENDKLTKVSDGHSLMGRGYFVLEGESPEILKKQAQEIKNLFQIEQRA